MKTTKKHKAGDAYEVVVGSRCKGYFQFIMKDSSELDSDVIRIFNGRYKVGDMPSSDDIAQSGIKNYRHVYLKLGLKTGAWRKIGNIPIEPNFDPPLFRRSSDYGNPKVKISQNWYIWQPNAPSTFVGKLPPEMRGYSLGGVRPIEEIQEIIETGESSWFYPNC